MMEHIGMREHGLVAEFSQHLLQKQLHLTHEGMGKAPGLFRALLLLLTLLLAPGPEPYCLFCALFIGPCSEVCDDRLLAALRPVACGHAPEQPAQPLTCLALLAEGLCCSDAPRCVLLQEVEEGRSSPIDRHSWLSTPLWARLGSMLHQIDTPDDDIRHLRCSKCALHFLNICFSHAHCLFTQFCRRKTSGK